MIQIRNLFRKTKSRRVQIDIRLDVRNNRRCRLILLIALVLILAKLCAGFQRCRIAFRLIFNISCGRFDGCSSFEALIVDNKSNENQEKNTKRYKNTD